MPIFIGIYTTCLMFIITKHLSLCCTFFVGFFFQHIICFSVVLLIAYSCLLLQHNFVDTTFCCNHIIDNVYSYINAMLLT